MTVNELVTAITNRVKELADLPIDDLRACYPVETDTRGEAISFCRKEGFSRGRIIEDVICEEFCLEFDLAIEE